MAEQPDNDDEQPRNPLAGTPFEQILGGLMSGDPSALAGMMSSLQRVFEPHEGSINWSFAHDLARQVVAQEPDPSPDAGVVARLRDVAQVADHWLDSATDLPGATVPVAAWSRAEWVEASMPTWQRVVEPVAAHVVAAMQAALPGEAQAMAGPMLGILNQVGSAMFTQQFGQAVGALSHEVLSATDIGIPFGREGHPAVVVGNLPSFGEGLGVSSDDVLLYVVLRELAHQRLYARAPWLRASLISAIEAYGRGITIDVGKIESGVAGIDPSNLESLQEALNSGIFEPEDTPDQRAALDRLETTLALAEGWVDDVVSQATTGRMPNASALRETMRRRRATGGPAEQTFAALVGLELRPRRLRDASTLWGSLRTADGAAARDAVWEHPDLVPTSADLDDPLGFAERRRTAAAVDSDSSEFDAALQALLEEGPDAGSQTVAPAEAGPEDADTAGESAAADDGSADDGSADRGRGDASTATDASAAGDDGAADTSPDDGSADASPDDGSADDRTDRG
jgi:putative hydrolase